MTEMRHLRCDRCDDDIIIASNKPRGDAQRGWVNCWSDDFERMDFCPNCWTIMLEAAKSKPL